ncbi:tyrosine-type recombinase/integrase [Gordonia paraffinivorans]|uniref:tyrosine-type recombinase/integrase n=1 Tax=Gordonia paraffinivorans TaxID=175628 RepID=UPI0031198E73
MSPRTLDDWWRLSRERANIAPARLHDARHTCASRLLAAGVLVLAVAAWLGHADGGVLALRVYGHADGADIAAAATALHRP